MPRPLSLSALLILGSIPVLRQQLFESCLFLFLRLVFSWLLVLKRFRTVNINSESFAVIQRRFGVEEAILHLLILTKTPFHLIGQTHSIVDVMEIAW